MRQCTAFKFANTNPDCETITITITQRHAAETHGAFLLRIVALWLWSNNPPVTQHGTEGVTLTTGSGMERLFPFDQSCHMCHRPSLSGVHHVRGGTAATFKLRGLC